jgi:glycosyltransferase involved in cell wall biosynthesis
MPQDLPSSTSILAVTSELPWPLDSGGHLRSYHLLRRLACDHRVTLLVPAAHDATDAVEALGAAGIATRVVSSSLGGPARQAATAAIAALRSEAYVMYRRHRHGAVAAVLPQVCREVRADVLYFDHLDSFVYPDYPGLTLVGDLHNVYSTLLARTAADETRAIRRTYLTREARLLARAESAAARRAHLLMTVSADDQRHFAGLGAARVEVVPNGVDCAGYAGLPAGRRGAPLVMFLGAMSWTPNALAAEFLACEVLPTLQATRPDVRLRIVGRDPSPRLRRLAERPGVEVTGSVPDVRPHLRDATLLAVPLNAGGGTRLKILEAFAAGLPVVSTPIGCEGIDAIPGHHLVVAELESFAHALAGALQQADRLTAMAVAARQLVEQRYDWDAIGRSASDAIAETVVARRRVS